MPKDWANIKTSDKEVGVAITLGELATLLGAELHGDAAFEVRDVAAVEKAAPDEITFLENERHLSRLAECHAGGVIIGRPVFEVCRIPDGQNWLVVDEPQKAFVAAMLRFRPLRVRPQVGVSERANVSASATIGEGCNVYPGAYIGDDVVLGRNCDVHPGAVVGPGSRLADEVVIHANVVLYPDVIIGSRSIIHANAVIGADGFGYRFEHGRYVRLPHTGSVVIEEDVEIGACTTIDRGMVGMTKIGAGTKVDNLVMIAHNCEIGRHNAFASQVGFAGSATTGDYVRCAGQVGISDHSHLGAGSTLGARSGVHGQVPDGQTYLGAPARPEKEQIRETMALRRVPEMRDQIKKMQLQLAQLQEQLVTEARAA